MKTTSISTSAMADAARMTLARLQSQLAEAQKEVTTGRHADVGLSLGSKAGQTVSLRQEHTRLQTIMDSNGLVSARLDAVQAALQALTDDAQSFISQLSAARNGNVQSILQGQAQAGLRSLVGTLNTEVNGTNLFAGINTDVKPVADYDQNPPAASKLAVDAAFTATFGFSQSDPAVAGISIDDMRQFLDTSFADLFGDPAWGNSWSQASDQNVRSRISSSELVETSVNANEDAIRKLTSAYTMVADLGTSGLSQATFQAVVDRASQLTAEAVRGLIDLQANLGSVQQRVTNANARMEIQRDVLSTHIGVLEGVDPYEASTRLSELLTQVETSYAMTARINQLTILNYL